MPIDPWAIAAPENRYLRLPREMSLRDALLHFLSPELAGQSWWHLVVCRADGSWSAERFSRLYVWVQANPRLLDLPLGHPELLPAATAVEQEDIGTAAAQRLARKSPGQMVVVTHGGKLAGILCTPRYAGGGPSIEEFRKVVFGAAALGPGKASARQTVRRYTDVSCPDRVALETSRFSVVVRLTVERSPHDAASRELEIALEQPIQVELAAPGFELLSEGVQEIRPVEEDRDSAPAVFDLRPLRAGHHRLEIEFFQKTNHLGMVSIPVWVTRESRPCRSRAKSLDFPSSSPDIPPPDLVLRVRWEQSSRWLRYSLLRGGGVGWDDLGSVELSHEPVAYTAQLFGHLSGLAEAAAGMPTQLALAASSDAVEDELQKKGMNLWQILPEGFRALYAKERGAWQGRSLLIHSDEPYIPWELIWPWDDEKDEWEDKGPWCTTLRLARWLRRDSRANGNAGAPNLLPLGSLACLASGDPGLPCAAAERDFLAELAKKHGIKDLSPREFTRESLLGLLKAGEVDWLHVATHGSFSDEAPDQDSALRLGDLARLTPEDLVGIDIGRYLRRKRPAVVLNSCESGRQGSGLVGLGGWANRLIGLGAGMFLGTLWAVQDASALELIKIFYHYLLEAGEPVGEALRRARLERHEQCPDDPGWMAYSLYAHPNGRCIL